MVILENLSTAQKNAENSLNSAEAGYIGGIPVDNASHQLIYTPSPGTTPTRFLLNFPAEANSETYNLTQGWPLSAKEWILYLLIYSTNNYAYQTSITLIVLLKLASNNVFSALSWVPILIPNFSESQYDALHQYSKGSYMRFNDQRFVCVSPINSGNNKDPYNNPSQWRLIIPPKTYPDWNTSIQYLRGDIITENSAGYIAIKSANQNQKRHRVIVGRW